MSPKAASVENPAKKTTYRPICPTEYIFLWQYFQYGRLPANFEVRL